MLGYDFSMLVLLTLFCAFDCKSFNCLPVFYGVYFIGFRFQVGKDLLKSGALATRSSQQNTCEQHVRI